ncbi:MAG: DUF4397 domain-containing protein [Acidimicrobiia bacterium]
MVADAAPQPTERSRRRSGSRRAAMTAGTALATALGATALVLGPGAFSGAGASGAPNATVTLAQGIDDAASVDVLLDGEICALRGVGYASISQRLALPAGEHTLTILPSNGACTSDEAPLASTTVVAPAGADLAVAARPAADGGGGVVSVQETDLSALPAFTTRIRVVNQTPGAISASVTRVTNNNTPLVVDGLAPGGSTPAAAVTRGAHVVAVTTAWGTLSADVDLQERRVVDVYVTGGDAADGRLVIDTQLADNAVL